DLADERLEQHRAQGEHEEHHRQRPADATTWAEQVTERLVPEPEDRRHRVIDEVQHDDSLSAAKRGDLAGGTGSIPPGCQGPQRSSRSSVNHDPRGTPWTVSASIAYALQLGENRQV